jgi:hypothetical protein
MRNRNTGTAKRRAARMEFWPQDRAWTGEREKGWFRAPRTLPLILALMASKEVSGNQDPTRVYLELLARHIDEGVIRMSTEEDHAYAAGYEGARGVRSWRERMRLLERSGFIKVKQIASRKYAYVLLVHPEVVLERLKSEGQVPEQWLEAYRDRQMETGEAPVEVVEFEEGDDVAEEEPMPA